MTQISVTFQGDSWFAVRVQMYEALGHPAQPSTAMSPEEIERIASDTIREKFFPPEAEALSEPTPAPTKSKKARNVPPSTAPEPRPAVPEPQPPVAQTSAAPERELPSLEALKAIVTAAVRAAQKGEGSKAILDLLPDFKAKTKLDFVMNAKDEHRPALADLITTAGLALEPA